MSGTSSHSPPPRPHGYEVWHPKVRAIYDYWINVHPRDGLPGRQHVDPSQFVRLLPNVYLLDVVRGTPLDFRYRVFGTELVSRVGRDVTWQLLSEIGIPDELYRSLVRVVEEKRIDWRRGRPFNAALPEYVSLERITLPLARDGITVDMLFGVSVFSTAAGKQPG